MLSDPIKWPVKSFPAFHSESDTINEFSLS